MGKSRKIQEMSESNEQFHAYVAQMEETMKKSASEYRKEFSASIDEFYKDDKTCTQIEGKSYMDYQIASEFSLDNICGIVQGVADEVFSDENGKTKEEMALLESLSAYRNMAAKVAVDFVCNVLSSVGVSQASGYQHSIEHTSVGPGVTLHLLVVGSFYDGKEFFKKQHILENFIEFRLVFSSNVALAEANIKYITDKLNEYVGKSAAYKKIDDMYTNLITSDEYFDEDDGGPLHKKANNYQATLDLLSKKREDAYASIRDVCGVKGVLKSASTEAASVVPEMVDERAVERANAPLLRYLEGKQG